MSHELSEQHPQVVLRSRYQQLKALLVLAAITVVSLAAAVVILAVEEDGAKTVVAAPALTAPVVTDTTTDTPGLRYDGGPDEGSRGPRLEPTQPTRGSAAHIGRGGPH